MVPLFPDKRKFNNAVSKLSCKPLEGMILHSVCFLEVGWSKLLVDIFHLVSGTSVCSNSSSNWTTLTTLFVTPLNHSCCCQGGSLDSNAHCTARTIGIHSSRRNSNKNIQKEQLLGLPWWYSNECRFEKVLQCGACSEFGLQSESYAKIASSKLQCFVGT